MGEHNTVFTEETYWQISADFRMNISSYNLCSHNLKRICSKVGDRVGVMRKSDNSLHFFLNGVNIGKSVKTIPAVLYGVVDVYGQAEQVTITGMKLCTHLMKRLSCNHREYNDLHIKPHKSFIKLGYTVNIREVNF